MNNINNITDIILLLVLRVINIVSYNMFRNMYIYIYIILLVFYNDDIIIGTNNGYEWAILLDFCSLY